MPFTDQEYFEVLEKNETVKEDLKDFLEFISKQWNK